MKKLKKIGLICVSILVCGSLAGCGNNTNSSTTSKATTASKKVDNTTYKFGQSVILAKGDQKAKMVIQSVTTVDPDDTLVTDVSHNYKDTHQYVIVTYKITAISNKVDLDAFDGSNVSVYDSKGQSSITSSNRDSVTPKELHKGETQVMKIGVGLRAKSSKVTIHYGDDTWRGKIDNNDGVSTSATPSNENASSIQNQKQQTSQSQIKDTGSQSQQTSSTKSSNSSNGIGNAQDAVNAARAKYGDNNGNVHWNYMIDGTTGQPIKNPDGSYFVKGTADDGTMTGTQYSVNVHPDGSITEN